MKKRKQWICQGCALIFAILLTIITFRNEEIMVQKELATEVLRFHVLANSDSKEDQSLKLKVKEEILAYMKEEIPDADSLSRVTQWAASHLDEIEEVAESVIRKEGYQYNAVAEVTNSYFPEKSYGDITFPEGTYHALRIEIGSGSGQNWWCVLYPNLCFIDSVHAYVPEEGKNKLKNVLDEDTYEEITATTTFRPDWFFF